MTRGAGVVPERFDGERFEADVFHLAATVPASWTNRAEGFSLAACWLISWGAALRLSDDLLRYDAGIRGDLAVVPAVLGKEMIGQIEVVAAETVAEYA